MRRRALRQGCARRIDLGIVGTEEHAAPPCFSGNAESLRILAGNPVDNALRYTPSGGQVGVSVIRTDREVLVRVADDGPGIPPANREREFDRFYRVTGHDERGGGLGLSIVRSIADAHGATVTLDNGAAAVDYQ
ncbi:sensor histidine kinase [Massilia sp. LXY-6]|uniref:sensor histidine kinase n=1 Tax=Massilia sp. LXY-6 TaxID=3379823 RepID=UPI003EDFC9C1